MPVTTPRIKVKRSPRAAPRWCCTATPTTTLTQKALKLKRGGALTYVHPFDDPDVIAGQGTIGMEILRQHPHDRRDLRPAVGGGGLISGHRGLREAVRPRSR